jgi:hypothetical protein
MPRKSAAALSLVEPRGRRLPPPSGLSKAERAAFVAAVRSVRPGHFAAEETPLLTAYASAIVQERAIAGELEAAMSGKAKDGLRLAHGRVVGSLVKLTRALRLGPMARNPSRNTRRPGTVEPSGELPWEFEPDDDEPPERLN